MASFGQAFSEARKKKDQGNFSGTEIGIGLSQFQNLLPPLNPTLKKRDEEYFWELIGS